MTTDKEHEPKQPQLPGYAGQIAELERRKAELERRIHALKAEALQHEQLGAFADACNDDLAVYYGLQDAAQIQVLCGDPETDSQCVDLVLTNSEAVAYLRTHYGARLGGAHVTDDVILRAVAVYRLDRAKVGNSPKGVRLATDNDRMCVLQSLTGRHSQGERDLRRFIRQLETKQRERLRELLPGYFEQLEAQAAEAAQE